MIVVNYLGGTGNCLTQYTYGRLFSEYTGQSLRAQPIDLFPELETSIGKDDGRLGSVRICQTSQHDQVLTFSRLAQMTAGFDVALAAYFEVGSIYYPYASIIRSWFNLPGDLIDATAIHVRGSDGEHNSPPLKYYTDAIAAMGSTERVYVFTDDPGCAISKRLSAMGYPVLSDTPASDFEAMRRHERIIIGNSTFAWWAAFLSNAVRVIQPEPLHGFRSKEVPNSYLKVQAWQQITY